jgi:transcription elongation factor SPT6
MTDEALFYALTGESPESLRVGQLLTVQVQAIRGDRVVCVLDSGLTGYIAKANVSDAHGSVGRMDEKVQVGMIVATRLLAVDMATYSVELTARTSELAAHERWEQAHLAALWERERYLMPDSPPSANLNADEALAHGNRNAKAVAVLMRNVTHPCFKNVTAREADELLKAKPEGDFLIRPSTSSTEHLTLCWKWNDTVVHFDVQELHKPKRFELGKKLRLGQETYDDLNELIARYVEPMSQLAREVADVRYFRRAPVEEVEREMREAKAKESGRIPYLVSPSQAHAGRYLLSYLPGARPKHELFTLTPRGLRFRSQLFPSIDTLIKHLKTSFGRRA